jgi:hypothetical protein
MREGERERGRERERGVQRGRVEDVRAWGAPLFLDNL